MKPENRTAGIMWMLATMVCFITLDATMKYSLQSYSLVEVTWARFFFATVTAIIFCGRDTAKLLVARSPKTQALRSVLLMTTTTLFGAGIAYVALPTGTVIMFMSPIFVTILSNLVLGEHVGIRRWSSIVIGFVGALIVIRIWETGFSGLNAGVLFLLGAALANACYQIATRQLRHEMPLTTLLYTAAAGTIVLSFALPFHWSQPSLSGWMILVVCGVAGGVGHLCLIKAFQVAPASVVAPFAYSSLVWATAFGFLIWRDIPQWTTLLGAALIIGSGLYIFVRERNTTMMTET